MKIVKGYKEKEAAIALFLGYTYHGNRASKRALKWESPNGTYLDSPPPYTRCLNAMAKARESIDTYEKKMNYAWHLDNLVNPEGPTFHVGGNGKQYPGPNWNLANASASQCADAFGRALNLWTEFTEKMKNPKRTKSFEHEDYYWEDKNTDECILISDLTEEEAKDALCECLYWIDKLKNKMDRGKGGTF